MLSLLNLNSRRLNIGARNERKAHQGSHYHATIVFSKRLLLLTLCLFFLSACSVKLAYNFLGFIFKWHIGSYVSLNKEQKGFVDDAVEDFHDWHRSTQLPVYAKYISGLVNRFENEAITGKWIHAETDKVQLLVDESVNKLRPSITQLIASLDEEQCQELLENFAKDREKYKKRYIDISDRKRQKRRKNQLMDQIGPFFGGLSKQQKEWIDEWVNSLLPYEQLTLKQQEIWSEKLEQALNVRNNPELLSVKLDKVMFYRTDDWDQELQDILDFNQTISYDLLARLVNSQSEKQRNKLITRLTRYQQDFTELSSRGH